MAIEIDCREVSVGSSKLQAVYDNNESILVIQDTSFLNYNHMTSSSDLGPIGENKSSCMGLVMHTSMVRQRIVRKEHLKTICNTN